MKYVSPAQKVWDSLFYKAFDKSFEMNDYGPLQAALHNRYGTYNFESQYVDYHRSKSGVPLVLNSKLTLLGLLRIPESNSSQYTFPWYMYDTEWF